MARQTGQNTWDIHGCDGCCGTSEWRLEDLETGVQIANGLIIQHKAAIRQLVQTIDTMRDERDQIAEDVHGVSTGVDELHRVLNAVFGRDPRSPSTNAVTPGRTPTDDGRPDRHGDGDPPVLPVREEP